MSHPQAGIFAEESRHHSYLEYDLRPGAGLSAVRAAVRAALDATSSAERAPHRVIAFGDELWRRLAPGVAPRELRPFRALEGWNGHAAPSTPHALWLWLHGDLHDENFAAALAAHRALSGCFDLALEERGFVVRDSRDLIGFIDGTANPKDDDRMRAALVPEGEAGAGGSYVFTQRWVHDLAAFEALPVAEQERVVGRTKPDSVELEGEAMPPDSHVSRTDLSRDGVALKIYRRSAPFGTVREHGLYFLCFACDPLRVEAQLESMYGLTGDGRHDRIIEFSRATTGAFYFAPSQEELAAAL